MAQTQNLMQEMAAAFGDSETGRRRLVTVYVGLAKELEEQLQVADPATKTAISSTFETLLARLSSGATDLSVLNWVAETFASLGAGFDTGGELNPRAAQYYEQSARALENLLARVDLDPALRVQIQFRLAGMRGKQRKYQEAMEVFQSLLSDAETSRNLLVQVAAADTLQRWADHSQTGQRSARYERAIQGDPRDSEGRRAVWGWGQIAKVTANLPKYVDSFHQARVNLTKCRIGLADSKQGAERLQLLKTAQRDISLTDRLYGLGDDQQRAEYDALMKTIQRGRGEPPVGLGAL